MKDLNEFGLFLKKRALWTHRFIERSSVLRLGVMEETITDMHLFSIADKYNDNVITRKFNRREEGAISGADYLWIIGEPGNWLPLLIQAKIINPKTQNCQHFDYKDGVQRKQLLQYARCHSFVPMYCIYSYVPPKIQFPDRFGNSTQDREDWACSFLSPKAVRQLAAEGKKQQQEILKYSIPWMDPFCFNTSDGVSGASLAEAIVEIRDSSSALRMKSIPRLEASKNSLQKRISWENLDTLHAIRAEIPPAICNWFNNKSSLQFDVPLTGASIISTIPINQIDELHR